MDIVKISLVKITSQLKAGEITLGLPNMICLLVKNAAQVHVQLFILARQPSRITVFINNKNTTINTTNSWRFGAP